MTDEKAIEKMLYDQQQGWIKSEDLLPRKEDGDRYGKSYAGMPPPNTPAHLDGIM